jgi:hypothetical protein
MSLTSPPYSPPISSTAPFPNVVRDAINRGRSTTPPTKAAAATSPIAIRPTLTSRQLDYDHLHPSQSGRPSSSFFKAELVGEDNPTLAHVERVGVQQTIKWRIRNSGKSTWPSRVVLGKVRGDIHFTPVKINSTQVVPGDTVNVEVKFKVQDYLTGGETSATFQLFDESAKQFFGEEFKLSIHVGPNRALSRSRDATEPSAPPLEAWTSSVRGGNQERRTEQETLREQAVILAEEFNIDAGIVLDVLRQDPGDVEGCRTQLMMLSGKLDQEY